MQRVDIYYRCENAGGNTQEGCPGCQCRAGAGADGATHQPDNHSPSTGNSKPNARLVIQHQAERRDFIGVMSLQRGLSGRSCIAKEP